MWPPSSFVVRRMAIRIIHLGHSMTAKRPASAPHELDIPLSEDRLAVLAKALGHPARVRILRLLATRDSCVTGQLAPELGLAASTVSEHLRILREAGLIETESSDGRPCYCLREDGLWSLVAGVQSLLLAEQVGEADRLVGQTPAAGR
jgi:ArsR family transcriptional regulator